MADLLYAKLRGARRSLRDVSRDLDLPADGLSKILSGRRPLEIGVVYDVLSLLGIHPDAFFTELSAELAIPAKASSAGPPAKERLLPEGPISTAELERLIDDKLGELLNPKGKAPAGGPGRQKRTRPG